MLWYIIYTQQIVHVLKLILLYYTKHYTLLLCGFNKDFNGTQYIDHSTFIIYWNGTI